MEQMVTAFPTRFGTLHLSFMHPWRSDFSELVPPSLRDSMNCNQLTTLFLTADIDWAPEFVIEWFLKELETFGVQVTLFATHDSPLLREAPAWCEIALHPDYTRGGSRQELEEKLVRLHEIYPAARGMRGHRNVFGNQIAEWGAKRGIRYDASSHCDQLPFLQPWRDSFGLTRIPYFWEDGIHLDKKLPLSWDGVPLGTPGLKVINVHPVLLYLNCRSDDDRRRVTALFPDLTQAPRSAFEAARNRDCGIGSLWRGLLEQITAEKLITKQLIALTGTT